VRLCPGASLSWVGLRCWRPAGNTSKVLGAAFRIPLARLIGPEGMGLYGMAYPLYAMILALSTAGIPVAFQAGGRKTGREQAEAGRSGVLGLGQAGLSSISGLLFTVLTVVMARVFVVARVAPRSQGILAPYRHGAGGTVGSLVNSCSARLLPRFPRHAVPPRVSQVVGAVA